MNYYGFYMGQEFHAYEYLGAHPQETGTIFRTFAPNAAKISVIGDFNGWTETPMQKIYDGNFWECQIENACHGMKYKYRIYQRNGSWLDHADPYGFSAELRPRTASVIYDLSRYIFRDDKWQSQNRSASDVPMNIYEIHAGSWKKSGGKETGWYTYQELADLLIPYLLENGYNYVELMPLSEYPCDESWGYQATGFFSPTSRYGTPDDLRCFIEKCHENNIGVFIDFVPVHFAVNDYALLKYDGTSLYEYPHKDVGFNEWGSCNFMHSRGEVRSFLQSSACYWLKEFHFDGLRMDAVNNLIYWQGDPARGENNCTIQFLQTMNKGLKEAVPNAILMAEDSSNYSGVTVPVEKGGLGFDYKWDMGWMNDTLSFMQTAPDLRRQASQKLTFSMHYFYQEKYLLPLSHDEVVHGKATILQKMHGDSYDEKFAQARAFYMYMFAHPGKKLNFMGNEIGHLREWDEKREQDWNLLDFPAHQAFFRFTAQLNRLYLQTPALYEQDYDRNGFCWLDCSNPDYAAYSFLRKSGSQTLLALFNFSREDIPEYELSLPEYETASLVFSSNWQPFGGSQPEETLSVPLADSPLKIKMEHFSGCYFLLK